MVPEHRHCADLPRSLVRPCAGPGAGVRVGRLGGEQSVSFLEEAAAETSAQETLEHTVFLELLPG